MDCKNGIYQTHCGGDCNTCKLDMFDATPIVDGRTCWQKPEEVINVNANKGEKKMSIRELIERRLEAKIVEIIEEIDIEEMVNNVIDEEIDGTDVMDEMESQIKNLVENSVYDIEDCVDSELQYYDAEECVNKAIGERVHDIVRDAMDDAIYDAVDKHLENFTI